MWRVTELKRLTWELEESFTSATWTIQHVSAPADAALLPRGTVCKRPSGHRRQPAWHGGFSPARCRGSRTAAGQAPAPGGQLYPDGGREEGAPPPISSCLRGLRPLVPAWERKGRDRLHPRGAGGAGKLPRADASRGAAPWGHRLGRVPRGAAAGSPPPLTTPAQASAALPARLHHVCPALQALPRSRRGARPTKGRAVPGLHHARTPGGGGEGDSAPAGPSAMLLKGTDGDLQPPTALHPPPQAPPHPLPPLPPSPQTRAHSPTAPGKSSAATARHSRAQGRRVAATAMVRSRSGRTRARARAPARQDSASRLDATRRE